MALCSGGNYLRLLGFIEENFHHTTSVELDANALSHDLGGKYQIVEDSGVDRRQRAAEGGAKIGK